MATRSESKARAAIESLHRENPSIPAGRIVFLPLDLASIRSVVKAAEIVGSQERKLDILVNNAAFAPQDVQHTDAGFEMGIGVCHVGHFVLVDRLLPLLKTAAAEPGSDVRVVTITSNAIIHMMPNNYDFRFSSPESMRNPDMPKSSLFKPFLVRYALAKTYNAIFARELQRKFDREGSPILSLAVHPGGVATDGAKGAFYSFVYPVVKLLMMKPDDGAITQLWAATAEEVRADQDRYKGQYLVPYGKVGDAPAIVGDEKAAREMWATTRDEVNKYLKANDMGLLSM